MRNTKSEINEKIMMKIFNQFFPNIFTTLKKWEGVYENPDYSQPKTLIKNFEKDIDSTIQPLKTRELNILIRFARNFLLRSSFVKKEIINIPIQMAKLVKEEAQKDSRYSLLLELMSEVEKHFPLTPLLVAFQHGDIRQTFPLLCSPMPFLEKAEKSKGEEKAFYIYEAMRHICEHIYQPYIKTLWQLSYLRVGELPPTKSVKFGAMINVCFEKLPNKFHCLIEPDASIMRNAPSHSVLNWIYETDSIVLKDEKKQIVISVNELQKRLESMLQISLTTISKVGQLYLFRTFGKYGFMEKLVELLPDLIANDKKRVQTAETEFNSFIGEWLKKQGIIIVQPSAKI